MTTTQTAKPFIWQDPQRIGPAAFAACYQRAAQLIQDQGYTSYPDYEGETGIDLRRALEIACSSMPQSEAVYGDLADELEQRLIGILITAGVLHGDMGDGALSYWERGHGGGRAMARKGVTRKDDALYILQTGVAIMHAFALVANG
jgi:hypothetical protein